MRKSLAAAIAAGLLLSACTDDGGEVGFEDLPSESPSAEPTETASAEAPSDEIDVTTTPDEITPEWVTAVVNTLLAEYGEMTAEILAMPVQDDPKLPNGFEERLAELFEGEYEAFARSELASFLTDADRRTPLLPARSFDALSFSDELVQIETDSCIVVVGRIDRSGTKVDGGIDESLAAVSLAPAGNSAIVPWRIRDILANTDTEGRPNDDSAMLGATLADYGAALDSTCERDS